MLVITEKEPFLTATFIAAYSVDANMLATTIVEHAFICI